jgi:hypothetical protein
MTIADEVSEVLVDSLGIDEEEIGIFSNLSGDLGAESIDFLDIAFRLEKKFSPSYENYLKLKRGFLQQNTAYLDIVEWMTAKTGRKDIGIEMPWRKRKEVSHIMPAEFKDKGFLGSGLRLVTPFNDDQIQLVYQPGAMNREDRTGWKSLEEARIAREKNKEGFYEIIQRTYGPSRDHLSCVVNSINGPARLAEDKAASYLKECCEEFGRKYAFWHLKNEPKV